MRLILFVLLFYSAWASKLSAQPDPRLKLCESIHNFTRNSKFSWKEKYKGIPPSIKFSVKTSKFTKWKQKFQIQPNVFSTLFEVQGYDIPYSKVKIRDSQTG